MPVTRKSSKKYVEDSEEEFESDESTNKPSTSGIKNLNLSDDSSSESDIETYLKKPTELNLNSTFFKEVKPPPKSSFDDIERNILNGVNRLSDSDDDFPDTEENKNTQKTESPIIEPTFQVLDDYTKKLEAAKKQIDLYNDKKKARDEKLDVDDILAIGEKNANLLAELGLTKEDLRSSDFETDNDSEKEDWEEINEKQSTKSIIPKDGVQITLEMPTNMRKKKGIDLLAAMKRRLNRIRKENQVYIHKVHLLCWLAHGNYINNILNKENLLGIALSLLPSQHCYPPQRMEISYLEQIVKWYKKNIDLNEKEKESLSGSDIEKHLMVQMNKKVAYSKNMFIYIFVCILRALGVQCRLVLSLQVEPLRPPASDLHSLSVKSLENKENSINNIATSKSSDKETKDEKVEIKRIDEKVEVKRLDEKVDIKKLEEEKSTKKKTRSKIEKDEPKSSSKDKSKSTTKEKTKPSPKSKSKKATKDDKVEIANESNKKSRRVQKVESEIDKKVEMLEQLESKHFIKSSPSPKKVVVKEEEPSSIVYRVDSTPKEKSVNSEKKVNKASLKKLKDAESSKKNEPLRRTTRNKKESNELPEPNSSTNTKESSDKQSAKKKPNLIKLKLPIKTTKRISQVDGEFDSSSSDENINEEHTFSIPQLDGAKDDTSPNKPKLKSLKTSKVPKKKMKFDSEDEFETKSPFTEKSPVVNSKRAVNLRKLKESAKQTSESGKKQLDVRNDIINIVKSSLSEERHRNKQSPHKRYKEESDIDSDFAPDEIKKMKPNPKVKVKRRVPTKAQIEEENNRKKTEIKIKKGNDIWVEVFIEAVEKWISVDLLKGDVHCVKEIFNRASHPISYVLTWDNKDRVKDVTKRYCTNWNTVTRKLRAEPDWWSATLKPFEGFRTARDREEDEDLAQQELDQPLPKTISEYKNHPLYVLKRHLLKFQAIYPADAPTIGFVRNEPVYARDCVYVLHSREMWVKEAKVVKPGEKPYKIVKARPKYDKLSNKVITDLPLEIFGVWQVQDYDPPTAENGIVPRNAYGNVELFKPCMLPKGTVHLILPGLNKVARKLNIDCATAVTGFDFHGGWNHPIYDGFIVCKEFEDTLIEAWHNEQEDIERREREKYESRVYGNWKKLIKGLFIRERLKAKYDFGSSSKDEHPKKEKPKAPKFLVRKK